MHVHSINIPIDVFYESLSAGSVYSSQAKVAESECVNEKYSLQNIHYLFILKDLEFIFKLFGTRLQFR